MQRVVLVDDHQLIRAGIKLLLESLGGYQVIAEFSTGEEAVGGIPKLQADLVFLDVSLPDVSGIDVLSSLRPIADSGNPVPKFLMLSMHSQPLYASRAIEAGASGYLLKDSAPEELEVALNEVSAGRIWVSHGIERYASTQNLAVSLTKRQVEVLTKIAHGLCTKQIAAELNVSPKTVETYRAQLMEKLGVRDVAGLVKFAVKAGFINL